MTEHYSIFDFLLGLGNHFLKTREFHKFGLEDLYTIIYDYATITFADDKILRQMITIDYALQNKIRPKVLFTEELDKASLSLFIKEHQLPHQQYRFAIIPVDFDYQHFVATYQILPATENVIVQYTGVNKPTVYRMNVEV